jgi:hypothetical protein
MVRIFHLLGKLGIFDSNGQSGYPRECTYALAQLQSNLGASLETIFNNPRPPGLSVDLKNLKLVQKLATLSTYCNGSFPTTLFWQWIERAWCCRTSDLVHDGQPSLQPSDVENAIQAARSRQTGIPSATHTIQSSEITSTALSSSWQPPSQLESDDSQTQRQDHRDMGSRNDVVRRVRSKGLTETATSCAVNDRKRSRHMDSGNRHSGGLELEGRLYGKSHKVMSQDEVKHTAFTDGSKAKTPASPRKQDTSPASEKRLTRNAFKQQRLVQKHEQGGIRRAASFSGEQRILRRRIELEELVSMTNYSAYNFPVEAVCFLPVQSLIHINLLVKSERPKAKGCL